MRFPRAFNCTVNGCFHLQANVKLVQLLILLFGAVVSAAAPVAFDLPATDGARHRSADLARSPATVLVFLATDCPISNRYSPTLHKLEVEYRARRVPFFALFSGSAATLEAARQYLREYSLDMPGLLDSAASLARQTGARVTPEAVVLSSAGEVRYRGRIDDRYVDWGKTRPVATQHDLHDALEAILAGKRVTNPTTKALGCAIPEL